MLKVGMEACTLNVNHVRGTGRYVFEILQNTVKADEIAWTAYAHNKAQKLHLPPSFDGKADIFEMRGHRFNCWEQLALPWRAKADQLDVLHCADNTVPLWQPVPTIVTIHDTVPWAEPSPDRLRHHYLHQLQGIALKRCAAVVTISESSKRDIVSRWPELADRLTVIPHGISDLYFANDLVPIPPQLQTALQGAPYLAYMGGPLKRKRFSWAMEVLAASGRTDLHLVACGFAAGTAPPPESVPQELRGRVHFAPFLSEQELVAVYRGALATLYPTLYEGFGFPAIEAQAAGTPIIFSPISSLTDLVGPLAFTPATHDMPAWQQSLNDIADMPPHMREARADRAKEWAKTFSWRSSAKSHHELYRDVARQRPANPS